MLELSIEGRKDFEVLDVEIKRGGVSYTIDTVKELRNIYPYDDLYLIVGSDLANDFSSWKDFDELKKIVKIVVAQRNQDPLKSRDDFIIVEITQIHISSSVIREHLRAGRSVEYLVKDSVLDYIKKHKLYR
jgi:nicotinate-nucleotide adenylyltransferase